MLSQQSFIFEGLKNQMLRVTSEIAGAYLGFEGKCVADNSATKTVQVFLANATGNVMLPEDQVTRIEPRLEEKHFVGQ